MKKYIFYLLIIAILPVMVGTLGCESGAPPPLPSSSPASEAAQTWELTNETGDIAIVAVTPFTNSGTFSETDDSPGWFVRMPGLTYRLHVGGNIVHTSGGDRWSFVGLTGGAGNAQTLGQGEGTANGQFPNATAVSGTLTLTTQTPIGTQTGTANWWGTRKE